MIKEHFFDREGALIAKENTGRPGERVLVVAAHPDDETLGAGGPIRKHLDEGDDVTVMVVTNGDRGGDPAVRMDESRAAADILGVSPDNLILLGVSENDVMKTGNLIVPQITQVMVDKGIERVYTHHSGCSHGHHRRVRRYTDKAIKLAAEDYNGINLGKSVDVLRGRGFEMTQQAPVHYRKVGSVVDISQVFGIVEQAIAAYPSQLDPIRHHEFVPALNRGRGNRYLRVSEASALEIIKDPDHPPTSRRQNRSARVHGRLAKSA